MGDVSCHIKYSNPTWGQIFDGSIILEFIARNPMRCTFQQKVAKISITRTCSCLSQQPYFAIFLISHKFYRLWLVADINIIT